jgi:hypothetical protein
VTLVNRRPQFESGGPSDSDGDAPHLVRLAGDARGLLDWICADPKLVDHCASAVDSMEVAARLETFGLSARVVSSKFGYPNVFAAAEVVFDTIPYIDVKPKAQPMPPMGRPFDLLRGALYAIPAVFFSVIILSFGLGRHWWLLPVGLTVSWGTSQAFSVLGWSMRAHNDQRSDSLLAASSMFTTAVFCFVAALVVRSILGGTMTCVAVTVSLGVYISASSILIFHSAERLLILCLIPALVGSLLSLGVLSFRAASWFVVASAGLVVIGALGSVAADRWRRPTFSRDVRRQALKFLTYGVGCGLMTSSVVGFGTAGAKASGAVAIAAGPLLVTLGLMEWQLRSLRSRTAAAMSQTSDLAHFSRQARSALARSITTYVGSLAVISAMAGVVAAVRHVAMAPLLILTVDALGISFFLALIFVSAGFIDRVLRAWLVTFFVMVSTLLADFISTGHVASDVGILAVLLASSAAIVTFIVLARGGLTSPFTYESRS